MLSEVESAKRWHDRSVSKEMLVMVLLLTAYLQGFTIFRLELRSPSSTYWRRHIWRASKGMRVIVLKCQLISAQAPTLICYLTVFACAFWVHTCNICPVRAAVFSSWSTCDLVTIQVRPSMWTRFIFLFEKIERANWSYWTRSVK